MENPDYSNFSISYSRLSIIGIYSTLLLIADIPAFQSEGGYNVIFTLLFIESIVIYLGYWIYLTKHDKNFMTYYFDTVLKPSRAKSEILKNVILVLLFAVSFVIPEQIAEYFQYSILMLALFILSHGLFNTPSIISNK